jgi:hypothetical protein
VRAQSLVEDVVENLTNWCTNERVEKEDRRVVKSEVPSRHILLIEFKGVKAIPVESSKEPSV